MRSIRYLLAAGLTLEDVTHFRCCLDGDLTTITTPAPALVAVAKRRLAVLDGRVHAITQVRDRLATELQKVGDDGAAR